LDVRLLDDLLGIKQRIACEFCGKKVQKNYMSRHMKAIHGEGKPGCVVECGQCDKRILLRDLSNHVLDYHLGLEESPQILSKQFLASSQQPSMTKLDRNNLEEDKLSDSQYLNGKNSPCSRKSGMTMTHEEMRLLRDNVPWENGDENSGNVTMLDREESGCVLFFDSDDDDDSDQDDNIDIVSKHTIKEFIPGKNDPPEVSTIHKHCINNFQDTEKKIEIKSFLNDVSDDTDDSDIVIEEIIPSLAKVKPDENHITLLKPVIQPAKVQFLVKCHEKNRVGGKVKSMRLVMRDVKTVGQAKRKYSNKQELDKNRIGELQFVMEGVILADEDKVQKLNKKIVTARQLSFLGTK